ncbi:PRC-barrel domain-containing protein [Oleisolibacter albus]|uniref:PRC-barrel domain-containing protein n=1 Tax=Oleisolibacter albus TaxID=2171757 RepID=UPI000DF2F09F|nr:PRC-barrel domain-containing protein [Oleisolibacter albus]
MSSRHRAGWLAVSLLLMPGSAAAADGSLSGTASAPVANAALAENLVGKLVQSVDGEGIGEIEDVLWNRRSGEVEAIIVATGGFLGLGERRIRLPWKPADLDAGADTVTLPMRAEQVAALPTFDGSALDEDLVGLRER